MAHKFMPVGISLASRPVLIVGGGQVALRKVEILIDYCEDITLISPTFVDKIEWFAAKEKVKLIRRGYISPEAAAYGFVIAASQDSEVNKAVSHDCRKSGVPVNAVDDPDRCDIIFPAIIRRDNLSVAISTDGQAPFLAGHLKMVLDGIFKPHWSKIAALAARFRIMTRDRWGNDQANKTACYERFLSADWKSALESGEDRKIEAMLNEMLEPSTKAGESAE